MLPIAALCDIGTGCSAKGDQHIGIGVALESLGLGVDKRLLCSLLQDYLVVKKVNNLYLGIDKLLLSEDVRQ